MSLFFFGWHFGGIQSFEVRVGGFLVELGVWRSAFVGVCGLVCIMWTPQVLLNMRW